MRNTTRYYYNCWQFLYCKKLLLKGIISYIYIMLDFEEAAIMNKNTRSMFCFITIKKCSESFKNKLNKKGGN